MKPWHIYKIVNPPRPEAEPGHTFYMSNHDVRVFLYWLSGSGRQQVWAWSDDDWFDLSDKYESFGV